MSELPHCYEGAPKTPSVRPGRLDPWVLRNLRHTNARWLEDGGRHGQRGSRMRIAYWHTTPDMQARAIPVIEEHLAIVPRGVVQPPNENQFDGI